MSKHNGLVRLTTLAVCAVLILVVSAAAANHLNSASAEKPRLTLAYPEGEPLFHWHGFGLPLEDLIEQSDVVVIGVVQEQDGYVRHVDDLENIRLTTVAATYSVAVEEHLKGVVPDYIKIATGVAIEASGQAIEEVTWYTDSPHPLEVGARYVLALRTWQDSSLLYPTTDFFRFRLEDGHAFAESTRGGADHERDPILNQMFPGRTEAELISSIRDNTSAETGSAN